MEGPVSGFFRTCCGTSRHSTVKWEPGHTGGRGRSRAREPVLWGYGQGSLPHLHPFEACEMLGQHSCSQQSQSRKGRAIGQVITTGKTLEPQKDQLVKSDTLPPFVMQPGVVPPTLSSPCSSRLAWLCGPLLLLGLSPPPCKEALPRGLPAFYHLSRCSQGAIETYLCTAGWMCCLPKGCRMHTASISSSSLCLCEVK